MCLHPSVLEFEWDPAIDRGGGKLVIRQWMHTSRWWNLNQVNHNSICSNSVSSSLADMAQWEIAAYRVARAALFQPQQVRIPAVLYCSVDDDDNDFETTGIHHSSPFPWAVLEYVPGNAMTSTSSSSYWMNRMIRHRHEFGFDEPHPRWGRLPSDDCLDYALLVLQQVMVPLHSYCRLLKSNISDDENASSSSTMSTTTSSVTVSSTIPQHLLERLSGYNDQCRNKKSHHGYLFQDMLLKYHEANKFITERIANYGMEDKQAQRRLHHGVERISVALQTLNQVSIAPLTPVLTHMDYQPQNVQFDDACDPPTRITAVFDWEESAWADPRFDVLLVGRKVCAHRDQAQIVWNAYQAATGVELGELEPWLTLETIHSAVALLLQAVKCGGRNPWETQSEVFDKLERELLRLDDQEMSRSAPT